MLILLSFSCGVNHDFMANLELKQPKMRRVTRSFKCSTFSRTPSIPYPQYSLPIAALSQSWIRPCYRDWRDVIK